MWRYFADFIWPHRMKINLPWNSFWITNVTSRLQNWACSFITIKRILQTLPIQWLFHSCMLVTLHTCTWKISGSDIFSWFYPVSLCTYLITSQLCQQFSLTYFFQFRMYQQFYSSTAIYISLRYQHCNRITQKRQSKGYTKFNSI